MVMHRLSDKSEERMSCPLSGEMHSWSRQKCSGWEEAGLLIFTSRLGESCDL